MNASLLFFALEASPVAENVPAASGIASVQTALLVIACGALLFLARSLTALRARVTELEHRQVPTVVPQLAESEKPRATEPAPALAPAPVVVETVSAVPHDILTVIAAAIHATLPGHARIIAITPQGDDRTWSLEGRRQIFHSHQIR